MLLPPSSAALLPLFIVASYNPLNVYQDAAICSGSYYGAVGKHNFFWVDRQGPCLKYLLSHDPEFASKHPRLLLEQSSRASLFWLERESVDESLSLSPEDELSEYLAGLRGLNAPGLSEGQHPLNAGVGSATQVLFRTPDMVLLQVDLQRTPILEIPPPRLWKASLISESPVPFTPVPPLAVDRVKQILNKVKFDPLVASVVNNISVPQLKNDIRFLTGEDGKSGIVSRHSFSDGILVAAEWLKARIEDTGATCELKRFLPGFGPNIICTYAASTRTTETVLLSAHYDSRGSFGSTRAPGADDDGSGTVSILGIARTIARRRVRFKTNVQLCLFAGEEQGLLGSRAYARELRAAGANLTLMVQADMLAYRAPGEPPQLGLPDLIGSPEVTQLVANVSAIYSPELSVGFTPACCSDHQSFHEQGFPATQVFERAGPIADPMYHNSGDLSDREGYDFGQLKSIGKVQFATLLHAAGFYIEADDE